MRISKKRHIKRKELMRKMNVMRKHKFQKQPSPGCSEGSGDELEMLKRNNSSLAKALSDQKIETNNWYTEAITLRGELLELREKQAREPVTMNVENVFGEIEKQVKEYYESIEIDFNSALDRLVKVVEKLTKVKQLVLGSRTTLQNSTHEISNIFPRTSGSRVTLSSSGISAAPRQRAVPPMVGGHVLQPVMVPLAKLKIDWNDRKRNHFLVGEGNEHNMSTIGEQSSPENNEVSEEQQSLDAEDDQAQYDASAVTDNNTPEPQSEHDHLDTSTETRLREDQPNRYNLRDKTPSPLEQTPSPLEIQVSHRGQRPSRRRRGRGSRRGRGFSSRLSKTLAAKSPGPSTEGRNDETSILDDPLEGPSWLLDVGRSSFYSRSRGRKTHRNKRGRPSRVVPLDSSDEESDGVVVSPMLRNGGLQRSGSRRKLPSLATTPTDTPPLSLDHSCLHSPSSMRARLGTVDGAVGRRSKRHLKRKFENSEDWEIVSLQQDEQTDQGTVPNTQSPVSEVGTPKKMVTKVNSVTDNNWQSCNTSSALISESTVALQEDANTTCKIVTNMDVTMPVSDLIIQENPLIIHDSPPITHEDPLVIQENLAVVQENPQTCIEKDIDGLQDELKVTQSKKKFFKTREMELSEEILVQCEKTPFDLSMINDTVVDIPPFSSTRATEKENLPPLSAKSNNEYASLCNVSVVLEDVMKQTQYSKTPEELIQSWKGSQSAKCVSSHTPRNLRSVSRKTLQYTVNCEDNEETEKPKRTRKTRKKSEFSSSLDNGNMRTSSTKTLIDDEVIDQELEDKMSDICQQEQPFDEIDGLRGHDEEVEPASCVSPDVQQDAETGINTDLIEKEKCEGNTQTEIYKDDSDDDCVVLDNCSDEELIQEGQGTCQEQINNVYPITAVSPNIGFEGFHSSETLNNCWKIPYQMKSFFGKSGKGSPYHDNVEAQESSDNKSNAEILSGDCGRRRRAALKVTSFKEANLNRKMRRGENNVVIVGDSKRGRGRSVSRGSIVKRQRRGRSTAADKAIKGEESS